MIGSKPFLMPSFWLVNLGYLSREGYTIVKILQKPRELV